ncbi:MAG: hypothetical protein KAZ88_00085 [Acidimicrobiia bacterium]|jgi:hypothetical protein|nr:hypothetical protein [Acidimicrobiia bacterium]MBP8179375.1 hypothetical protein [Acidimicrobiia bacterium]
MLRRVLVGLFVLLGFAAMFAAGPLFWLNNDFSNADKVGDLATEMLERQPVADGLAYALTQQVITDRPVLERYGDQIESATEEIVESPAFTSTFRAAVEVSYNTMMDDDLAQLVLNLAPEVNSTFDRIRALSPEAADMLPDPGTVGVLTLADRDQIPPIWKLDNIAGPAAAGSILVSLASFLIAGILAKRPTRILVAFGLSAVISGILTLVALSIVRSASIDSIAVEQYRDAAHAGWDVLFSSLVAQSWMLAAAGLAAAALGLGLSGFSGDVRR